ncbi:MAG: hypothetical protein PWP54_1403 [Thermosipho sp. (in: thermotogales)]|nr:hypothetical protein [Thermosipho sp. (in: thermotogales)]
MFTFLSFLYYFILIFFNPQKYLILSLFAFSIYFFTYQTVFIYWLETKTLINIYSGRTTVDTVRLISFSLNIYGFFHVLFNNILNSKFLNIKKHNKFKKYNNIKVLYYLVLILFLIEIIYHLEALFFVMKNGYISYYKYFVSVIPEFIKKFSSQVYWVFWIFVFIVNYKKEYYKYLKKVFFIYFTDSFLVLLIGKRGHFILTVLLYLIYIVQEKGFLSTKKQKIKLLILLIILLIITPLIFNFLFIFGELRKNWDFSLLSNLNGNLLDNSLNFMKAQGLSGLALINFAVHHKDFNYENSFLLAPFTNYFKQSIYAEIIGKKINIEKHSRQEAFNSGYLSYYFAYLFIKDAYLSGQGTGSSYIAEAYLDLGYLGLFLVNFIYSVWIYAIYITKNPLFKGIGIYTIYYIIFSPRSVTFDWLIKFFQPSFIITLAFVIILLKIKIQK